MGIPGLTTFINDHSDRFLRPYELRNTILVIDGHNIACHLYVWYTNSLSAFGGDYDVYDKVVRDFFGNLKKCNVTPIVIFDGGYEVKKLRTVHKRTNDQMALLMNFNNKCWTGIFFPLLIDKVFMDVLYDLNVRVVQCFFEADREIAAVARRLKCPVLSYDSDFYIFDVLYIPFRSMEIESKIDESGFYLYCCLFNADVFVQEFQGLEKNVLPLMPALLGNDYVDNRVFNKFFNHVIIPSNSSYSYTQRKIYGLMHWLKKETLDSAIQLVISHIQKDAVEQAHAAINMTIDDYKQSEPVIMPLLGLDNSEDADKPLYYEDHEYINRLPKRFVQLYQKCKLLPFLIDMIHLGRYYLKIQVEDVTKPSSHCISYPIISAIFKILCSFTGKSGELVLYKKNFRYYAQDKMNYKGDHVFEGVNINNIMNEPEKVRRSVIYKVLSFNEDDIEACESFNTNWITIVICFIFWVKQSEISCSHFHSFFLMAIANYVQSLVGQFKNYKCFMNSKAGTINRLSKYDIDELHSENATFFDILNSVNELELLLFTKKFIKLRKNEPETTSAGYFMPTIHLFARFQSVLSHVLQLNALMDFPFPQIKIAHFYSGTLLYNLYYLLNTKSKIEHYVLLLLADMPNIRTLYNFIKEKLEKYNVSQRKSEKPSRPGKRTHKKKKKK